MQWERPARIFARSALTAQGWQRDVLVSVDDAGTIGKVEANSKAPAETPSFDVLIPGLSNVHSHAFQRAMAGLTEIPSGKGQDNFWSWREVMYAFTKRLTPEHVEAITRHFHIELLKSGYTSVAEFHYLHHDAAGKPYANPAELSERTIAGAHAAGIHLTHLPVLYETSTFGGAPANEGQKRFLHTPEAFLRLIEILVKKYGKAVDVTLGAAPHSLRAIRPETWKSVLDALPGLGLADCPLHIHAAEQEKEVADCIAWSGERPVEWLLNHQDIDARWCLIHATHMTEQETKRLAASGAVAGLCPTTEGDLGDGIFPGEAYIKAGGRFAVGSDSNVSTSPFEELRMLEYAQRLTARKRNVLSRDGASTGRTLFDTAAASGAQALGIRAGTIATGQRADMIALSTDSPFFADKKEDQLLDTLIFATAPSPITDVFVAGKRVIANGKHIHEKESAAAWRKTLSELRS